MRTEPLAQAWRGEFLLERGTSVNAGARGKNSYECPWVRKWWDGDLNPAPPAPDRTYALRHSTVGPSKL